jgi:hypothetical protein
VWKPAIEIPVVRETMAPMARGTVFLNALGAVNRSTRVAQSSRTSNKKHLRFPTAAAAVAVANR